MKKYSKSRGIITLICFVLLLALVAYTAIHGFGYDYSGSMSDIKLGLDLRGGVSITYQTVEDNPSSQDMEDTKFKLEQRVATYSTEANVYTEGSNRITIDIPGEDDADEVLSELGNPGTLIFCTDYNDIDNTTRLTGDDIKDAYAGTNSDNEYVVVVSFTDEGVEKFAEVTAEIAGTDDPLYIIYDDTIISAPTCDEEINSPSCTISGSFTYDSASQLASYIRIGSMPLELEELRSQVVGATLGSNAIRTSLIAAVIGLIAIFILLIVNYRIPGLCASLALIFYTFLIIVILASFNEEITLTLPGIAGIILGIGMAVDANCIIFSRLREEIGKDMPVAAAIDSGFKKAFSAIIDGNVTTLIAAVVLYIFGSGTVKGFAITLALGIVLSMFTALIVTRTLLKAMYAIGIDNPKAYGSTKHEKIYNFVSKKNIFFSCSGLIIAAGIVVMVICGIRGYALNFSLDFVGGTSTDVFFNEEYMVEQLETDVEPLIAEAIGSTDVTLTPVVNSTEVIIKTQVLTQEQREAMYDVLEDSFDIDTSSITYENISGIVSAEMARSAIISVILASIAMLIYIWIRFRDIRFASASVLCLVHDCLVVLAFYAFFRWTVGNTFIACMLTLVGYSINATIVIFDRIRENIGLLGEKADLKLVVNKSVTETLGRSINTSLTTLFMVVALCIFGVTSIREFALPLTVGIIVGGYSSVCLAGSLWYVFRTKFGKKRTRA